MRAAWPATDRWEDMHVGISPGAISAGWPARRGRWRAGVRGLVALRHRARRGQGGDRRRRRRRRHGGPLSSRRSAPKLDVTLIEANPIYSSLVLLQPLHRRLPHAGVAQPRLRRPARGSASRWCTTSPPTSTPPRRPSRRAAAAPSPTTGWCSRPASTSSTTRSRAIRARPPAIMPHAYTTDAAGKRQLKRQLAGHARRRHRRDGDAEQSLPLPARPLRARLHDRALPQDQEAEVEARHPRPEEGVLQAAGVHRGLRQVLQGHHRAEPDHRDRRLLGGQRRCQDQGDRRPRPARR